MSEVTIKVNMEGLEEVTGGFQEIGNAAEGMGNNINTVFTDMQTNYADLSVGAENLGLATSNMANSVSSSVEQMDVQYSDLSVTMGVVAESSRNMEMSYRSLFGQTASGIMNSMQLADCMDRLAKGQMDAGRAALLLGVNFLQLGSNIYTLYKHYANKIAVQAASIAGDIREAASNLGSAISERVTAFAELAAKYGAKIGLQISSIAGDISEAGSALAHAAAEGIATAAAWARTIAEQAKAIALAIANALEGPLGWVILAGAAAAAAGGIALASRIPSREYGGKIEKTGPHLLHYGEYVLPEKEAKFYERLVSSNQSLASITKEIDKSTSNMALIASKEKTSSFLNEKITSMDYGGLVQETKEYRLEKGEYVLPVESVKEIASFKSLAEKSASFEEIANFNETTEKEALPLGFLSNPSAETKGSSTPTIIYVYIQDPVFRTRGDMDYLVDRLKRMGMA